MKNLWYVFLLCVVASCTVKKADEVTVRVKVDNMAYSKVAMTFNAVGEQADLDAKGEASFTVKVPDYAYARLFYGEDSKLVFLEKGEDVKISFDGRKFNEGIQFEGKNAPVVDFLNTVNYSEEGLQDFALPLDEYVKVIEARTGDALELLAARKLEEVNPRFVEMEKERIKYTFALNILMYPVGHPLMIQDTTYRPGDDYYELLQQYMVENEDWVNIPEYREYLREAMITMTRKGGEDASGFYNRVLANVKYMGEHFTNEKVKQPLITIFAIEYIYAFGTKDIEELNTLCNQYITDPELKAEYQAACERKG